MYEITDANKFLKQLLLERCLRNMSTAIRKRATRPNQVAARLAGVILLILIRDIGKPAFVGAGDVSREGQIRLATQQAPSKRGFDRLRDPHPAQALVFLV